MEYVYKEPQKNPLGVDHIRDSMACLTNVCTPLKYRRLSLGNTTSNLHWSVLLSAPLCDGMTKLARLGKSNPRVCQQCMIWIYNPSIFVVFRKDLFNEKYFILHIWLHLADLKINKQFLQKIIPFCAYTKCLILLRSVLLYKVGRILGHWTGHSSRILFWRRVVMRHLKRAAAAGAKNPASSP